MADQETIRCLRGARARRGAARGFTLIELMVSLTAGLIISTAAFMMARSATTFFQHEAGITAAQYSAMVGMARLQADLKNASYLGTPNVNIDPLFCGNPALLPASATVHPGARDLAGVNIVSNGSFTAASGAIQALWTANGLSPDALTISGSFDTTEQFAAATVTPTAGGAYDVVLNFVNDGASIRTLRRAAEGGASFQDIFRSGRLLRVREPSTGFFGIGVITGVVVTATNVTISLAGAPSPLGTRQTQGNCGCSGFCGGAPVSVIARMHYNLRSVGAFPAYANLAQSASYLGAAGYHKGPPPPNLANRTELTRIELDESGNEIAATLQVFSEFAVDFEIGASYETVTAPGGVPVVRREPVGDTANTARYGAIGSTPGAGGSPDLIRALQVRLSTRAHRSDRDVGIPDAADGHPYRFDLGAEGFARLRTLVSDIQLPNQSRRLTP